jgi:acetyltransferase-like isoleucine patch superfamily enzyme
MSGLLRHLWTALRERAGHRRAWLALARRLPPSARLSYDALVIGRAIDVGAGTSIGAGAVVHAGDGPAERIVIGRHCRISPGARVLSWGGPITIGDHCSINASTVLYGTGGITIGAHVRIAANTTIVASQHAFERTDEVIARQGFTASGIVIEDDVWIGAGVCVLDGVRVRTGAILAAGAVVTRDVDPFTIVGGVPATVLRARQGQPGGEG